MDRKSLKNRAKIIFKNHYGMAILATIVPGLIIGMAAPAVIIGTVLLAPLFVGQALLFLKFSKEDIVEINPLFSGFQSQKYLHNVLYLFLQSLFIFLWFLLLIIPGVIKIFSYALTPYILADDTVESDDPITLSRQWMDGYKVKLLVLELSFIGWYLLSALTLGVLYIFYVGPYIMQARALFYEEVKLANQTKQLR